MSIDPRAAREAQINDQSEAAAAALLVELGRIPNDQIAWGLHDLDLIKKTALPFRPLVAQNLNLDDSLHELERRFNVATLTQPKPSLLRRAIGPLAFLALAGSVAYLEWRDMNGDRAIYEEMEDQIINARADAFWNTYSSVQPVQNDVWKLNSNINEPEARLLGDDHTMDVLHVLLEQDWDSDGVVNAEDDCVDIIGVAGDTDAPDHKYWAGGNGCPLAVDTDEDNVADFRDACIEAPTKGEVVIDHLTMRGPKSLFPHDQGCSLTQVRNRCTKVEWLDEKTGVVWLMNCPGEHIFQCTWKDGAYQDCSEYE